MMKSDYINKLRLYIRLLTAADNEFPNNKNNTEGHDTLRIVINRMIQEINDYEMYRDRNI